MFQCEKWARGAQIKLSNILRMHSLKKQTKNRKIYKGDVYEMTRLMYCPLVCLQGATCLDCQEFQPLSKV